MSTLASEMRRLIKDRAAKKAARKKSEVTGPEPHLTKELSGMELCPSEGVLAVVPLQAVVLAAFSASAQPPVIDLEAGAAVSQSSGKRGPNAGAIEDNTRKRPRTRRAGSAARPSAASTIIRAPSRCRRDEGAAPAGVAGRYRAVCRAPAYF